MICESINHFGRKHASFVWVLSFTLLARLCSIASAAIVTFICCHSCATLVSIATYVPLISPISCAINLFKRAACTIHVRYVVLMFVCSDDLFASSQYNLCVSAMTALLVT